MPHSRCLRRLAYVVSLDWLAKANYGLPSCLSRCSACCRGRLYGLIVQVNVALASIIVINFFSSGDAQILILRLIIILANFKPCFGRLFLALNVLSIFIPLLVLLYLFSLVSSLAEFTYHVQVCVWIDSMLFKSALIFLFFLYFLRLSII